jgi:hypothetical protein
MLSSSKGVVEGFDYFIVCTLEIVVWMEVRLLMA